MRKGRWGAGANPELESCWLRGEGRWRSKAPFPRTGSEQWEERRRAGGALPGWSRRRCEGEPGASSSSGTARGSRAGPTAAAPGEPRRRSALRPDRHVSSGRDLSKLGERLLIYYPKHTHRPPPSARPSPAPPTRLAPLLSRLAHTVAELKPNLPPLQLGFPEPAAGFGRRCLAGPRPWTAPRPPRWLWESSPSSYRSRHSAPLSASSLSAEETGEHGPGGDSASRHPPAGRCGRTVGGVRVQAGSRYSGAGVRAGWELRCVVGHTETTDKRGYTNN